MLLPRLQLHHSLVTPYFSSIIWGHSLDRYLDLRDNFMCIGFYLMHTIKPCAHVRTEYVNPAASLGSLRIERNIF